MPDFGAPFSGLANERKLTDSELIRAMRFMVSSEYEATQMYTQLAESTDNKLAIKVLLEVADEERVHAGEFLRVLHELAPDEKDFYAEGEKETEKHIRGKGKNVDKISELISGMVELANMADDQGLYQEADKLTEAAKGLNLVKIAQYEGGSNYWIANSRAFERAWKIKREKKKLSDSVPKTPEDFRSAQECWFEVLEEFQDGLLGTQEEFNKYAAAKDKDKKKEIERSKKETEKAQPGMEMSGPMTKWHRNMDDEAKQEGESIGEHVTHVFGPKGLRAEVARAMGNKISERLMAGSAPGVALYEAMDYFASGQYEADACREAQEALDELAKKASDNEAMMRLVEGERKMIGSQIREPLEESGYELAGYLDNAKDIAVLKSIDKADKGKMEIWTRNDHFAGYVIELHGVGYEFVRDYHPERDGEMIPPEHDLLTDRPLGTAKDRHPYYGQAPGD